MRFWDDPFPYLLIEVLNGTLAVVEFWMFFFGIDHLRHTYIETRRAFHGRGRALRTLRAMYRENKPEIALMVIIASLCVRTFSLWYLRFLSNHHYRESALIGIQTWAPQVLTFTTITMIIGVACWIRVVTPYEGKKAAVIWSVMIGSSVLFALGFAFFA